MQKFKIIGKPLLGPSRLAVTLQAHMPAVRPEMTIWGVKGGSPHFFLDKSFLFCYLERHETIQNCRQTPYGRKVSGRKKKEKERKYTYLLHLLSTQD